MPGVKRKQRVEAGNLLIFVTWQILVFKKPQRAGVRRRRRSRMKKTIRMRKKLLDEKQFECVSTAGALATAATVISTQTQEKPHVKSELLRAR